MSNQLLVWLLYMECSRGLLADWICNEVIYNSIVE